MRNVRFKIIPYTPAVDKLQEMVYPGMVSRIKLDQTECIIRVKASVQATQAEPIYSEEEMLQYLRNNLPEWENEI